MSDFTGLSSRAARSMSAVSQRHGMHELFASPIVTVGDFVCCHDNRDFGPDEPTEHDTLVFVRSGVFERRFDGRTEQADPTRIVFFRAGDVIRVRHPLARGDRCTSLRVAPAVLAELVAQRAPRRVDGERVDLGRTSAPCSTELFDEHWSLLERARRAAPTVDVEERALDLASAVLDATLDAQTRAAVVRAATRRTHGEIVEELQRLLAQHWREKLSLHDLARALRWSPYHLVRLFRAATGVSIHRYVTSLRLRHALERILDTRDELAEIALDCGFASHSHFDDSFRREFGRAPSSFRR